MRASLAGSNAPNDWRFETRSKSIVGRGWKARVTPMCAEGVDAELPIEHGTIVHVIVPARPVQLRRRETLSVNREVAWQLRAHGDF